MRSSSIMPASVALLTGLIGAVGCTSMQAPEDGELGTTAQACHGGRQAPLKFYVPRPNPAALGQIAELRASGERKDARSIRKMVQTPQAVWLNGGTPQEIKQRVRREVKRAKRRHEIPVFAAYNIPFRDCAQFSAGGATTTEEYLDWIDGVARGIGTSPAVVILEPDGLGIIPFYTPLYGDQEWCQPGEADPETAAAERFVQLNAALDRLQEQPHVSVYLDGTHSNWLGAGEAANRLVQAGVERAAGFFLNVSNYEPNERLLKHGTWISQCIAFANNDEEGGWRLGHYDWCPSQYNLSDPADVSTWSEIDDQYADMLGSAVPAVRFVMDTSRNGQGAWPRPPEAPDGSDVQDWCNPPDRGLGLRPTAHTGLDLVDAYLWIKIPGESDGECNRWNDWGEPDPIRNMMDPPAGEWFPEMALELVHNANPPL